MAQISTKSANLSQTSLANTIQSNLDFDGEYAKLGFREGRFCKSWSPCQKRNVFPSYLDTFEEDPSCIFDSPKDNFNDTSLPVKETRQTPCFCNAKMISSLDEDEDEDQKLVYEYTESGQNQSRVNYNKLMAKDVYK
mmetsp:Transcript_30070/g.68057  ORF Transcript_30070/g.68057 Transcript_30070/m.68057 type:complete len:137 (-) Transcript_30070:260-670(-)|eukprot:760517-Hanusia_phi.AAC.2